jgi:hypothetical protein
MVVVCRAEGHEASAITINAAAASGDALDEGFVDAGFIMKLAIFWPKAIYRSIVFGMLCVHKRRRLTLPLLKGCANSTSLSLFRFRG